MTRDEAIKLWLLFGSRRLEEDFRFRHPAHRVDTVVMECAEDMVDGLIGLGLLKVDSPSPQVTTEVRHD